ncbi:MAG: AAA family ATPase [Gammaproteobacteria bacterium]|jgi:general secretion pathway protein A|nr:AAA family ATPase [Gammaproteobacteria bacterium]
MYTSFFGLHEKPFSITPDPRYLFMSERHGEALAHLVYGVTESGGFVQLTGEVGTGKTTLVRSLLLNRMPDNADVAVVLNPQITAHEFLLTICEELGVDVPEQKDSIKALTDALNHHLLSAHADGRRTILVVDEAQNLAPAVLEQVRLLTNLETAKQKLLQIILIGQPELRELLGRNDLRQLAQRITGRYHLEPLTREETAQYVEHRLRVAGALGEVIDSSAKKEVFRLSQGVPRLINVICDRALLGAYSQESRVITRRLIKRAAAEVSGELEGTPVMRRFGIAAGFIAVAIIAGTIWSMSQESAPVRAANNPVVTTPAVEEDTSNVEQRQEAAADSLLNPLTESVSQPAAAAAPEQATLSEQLALAGELTTVNYARASLFDLWNLDYRSGSESACSQAASAGLACLYQRGSWNGLRQLNRPAILSVIDESGSSHSLVLVSVNDNGTAELSIGGVVVTHPVSEISDIWFGQYMLLWRPPGGVPVSLVPGSRGAEVVWLRQRLAEIDDNYISNVMNSDEYDSNLQNIVRRFQRDNRLDVDGLAGQQTLIVVNSLLGSDGTPRLTPPPALSQLGQD